MIWLQKYQESHIILLCMILFQLKLRECMHLIEGHNLKEVWHINLSPLPLKPVNSLSPVSLTPVINIHSRISEYLREFSKKFESVLMGYSGARGKLIHAKTLKQKISCQTPFNGSFCSWKMIPKRKMKTVRGLGDTENSQTINSLTRSLWVLIFILSPFIYCISNISVFFGQITVRR